MPSSNAVPLSRAFDESGSPGEMTGRLERRKSLSVSARAYTPPGNETNKICKVAVMVECLTV